MIKVGLKHEEEEIVTIEKTAGHIGSGAVSVYATPMMILLMEKTAASLVSKHLAPGQNTVGTKVDISHLSATPAGAKVRCECELVEVDRRRLVFFLKVFDEWGLIGEGKHERFIIDTEKFIEKTAQKLPKCRS